MQTEPSIISSLLNSLGFLFILSLFFFAIRKLVLWYWKVEKIEQHLLDIAKSNREILRRLQEKDNE